jgi:DNA-binding PadR family transcriptional regulator
LALDPSILDYYLLSMIDRGTNTSYELLRKAGLSLGASTPSLRRLLKAGLISLQMEEETSMRPRHQYALTDHGKRSVREAWKTLLVARSIPPDLDSILRVVDMALHYGGDRRKIAVFLLEASRDRQRLAGKAAIDSTQDISYVGMRKKCDARRMSGEAEELRDLAQRVKPHRTRPSGKHRPE